MSAPARFEFCGHSKLNNNYFGERETLQLVSFDSYIQALDIKSLILFQSGHLLLSTI